MTHPTAITATLFGHGTENVVDFGDIRPDHLNRWLAVTREYLFADGEPPATPDERVCAASRAARRRKRMTHVSLRLARLESAPQTAASALAGEPALRGQLLSWAHGQVLRLLRHAERSDSSPLRVLKGVFRFQVAFAANHPLVPMHLLAALAADGDAEARRRVQNVVGHYEAKLAKLIERAHAEGEVDAAVDPRAAARLFIALTQGLMIRLRAGLHTPGEMRSEAAVLIPMYLDALRAGPIPTAARATTEVSPTEQSR